ncbi:MAG: hypothetical protein LH629_01120, partial [Ignavibacteria bacterium]|nr:hypothetical protein [Ignavibacteria bacterium]
VEVVINEILCPSDFVPVWKSWNSQSGSDVVFKGSPDENNRITISPKWRNFRMNIHPTDDLKALKSWYGLTLVEENDRYYWFGCDIKELNQTNVTESSLTPILWTVSETKFEKLFEFQKTDDEINKIKLREKAESLLVYLR